MANRLNASTQQQVRALLHIGWSHRRIARELHVNRETVMRYKRLDRGAFRADPITPAEGTPPITHKKLDDRERRIEQFRLSPGSC